MYPLLTFNNYEDIAPHINDDQGRRLSLVEECHQRWIETAKSNKKN